MPRAVPRRALLAPGKRAACLAALVSFFLACNQAGAPAPSATPRPVCGNGIREAGEECDDGNLDNNDGCLATCQLPVVWTTSDPHVHGHGCSRRVEPDELAGELRQQQIQLGAALVWGEGYGHDQAFFTGRDHPLSTPSFILHYDLEVSHFAAARGGHLVLLGLDSLAFSPDVFHTPESGVPIVDWARAQPRAVVGMAHAQFWPADGSFPSPPGGCCMPFEVVVHAARGRLDFLSMEKTLAKGPGSFRLWRALQNAGFRVAISGASDWSCIAQRFDATTPRTDAILDGPLSYDNWLAALKAGRTTAAIGVGNHLNLRVEGHRMGDEVDLSAAQDVVVTLETAGPPTVVDVLVNGALGSRVPVAGGVQVTQVSVPVSVSSWVAARNAYVLTSPVYVLVGGRPIRPSPDDVCYLWRSVEHLSQVVMTGQLNLYGSQAAALGAYKEASAELRRRFLESGGVTCR